MAGVLKNRVVIACFEENANRHRVGNCRGVFHEAEREFDYVTESRRRDFAVLDCDFVDLHDKRALARHAPFTGFISTTVPIRASPVPDLVTAWR